MADIAEPASEGVAAEDWYDWIVQTECARRLPGGKRTDDAADYGGKLVTIADFASQRVNNVEQCDGDAIIRHIRKVFEFTDREENWPRSELQKEIHATYMAAVMHHLYGSEFQSKATALKLLWEVDDFCPRAANTMPRRSGKTIAAALFVTILLVCMTRNFVIDVLSSCERQSDLFLGNVIEMVNKICKDGTNEIKHNKTQLRLKSRTTGAVRTLNAYPGGVSRCFFLFRFSCWGFSSSSFVCLFERASERTNWHFRNWTSDQERLSIVSLASPTCLCRFRISVEERDREKIRAHMPDIDEIIEGGGPDSGIGGVVAARTGAGAVAWAVVCRTTTSCRTFLGPVADHRYFLPCVLFSLGLLFFVVGTLIGRYRGRRQARKNV